MTETFNLINQIVNSPAMQAYAQLANHPILSLCNAVHKNWLHKPTELQVPTPKPVILSKQDNPNKRTRTQKAYKAHNEKATKRLEMVLTQLNEYTIWAKNQAEKLSRPLTKYELNRRVKKVLEQNGYSNSIKSKPFLIWHKSLPDNVADHKNRAQQSCK